MNGNTNGPPNMSGSRMDPSKPFFPVLSHLGSSGAPFLPPWPATGASSPLFLGSMVVPPAPLSLPDAFQQVQQKLQQQQQQQQQRTETPRPGTSTGQSSASSSSGALVGPSPNAAATTNQQFSSSAAMDSDDDDLSSDAAGGSSSRKRKKGSVDESEGNSGGDDDKTKKRREQIAAASRASRARRKRELEDLRAETKQLKEERERLVETIQKMQRKVEDLQQRPIMLVENPAKASSTGTTFPNVLCEIGARSAAVIALMTVIRDKTCSRTDYVKHSDRLCRILAEEGLARCKLMSETRVTTPTQAEYLGLAFPNFEKECCLVSIMRSGDIVADAIRAIIPNIPVGKVLIQRQEETADKAALFYWSKLPHDIANRYVFICDPMLGTGGTIISCMRELINKKVNPRNVLFLNIVSCPEGLQRLHKEFPDVMVVTCAIDSGLNSNCYIVPGLGDYGDRFYHTTEH